MVFHLFSLLDDLTVADNVLLPAQLAGMPRSQARARVRAGAGRAHVASAASDAVEAQRRFLAYAAHELRGEITLQVALAQGTLADLNADTAALRAMGEQVVAACWRQERLLEALLTSPGASTDICDGSPSTSPRPPAKSCEPTTIMD